ncbi:MAG: T9SS type A sorting domain-containing protein [Bacteroidia bacterium]|nr:T9SS type A sorting domain-containing protein [Bacteroidia bacterium]
MKPSLQKAGLSALLILLAFAHARAQFSLQWNKELELKNSSYERFDILEKDGAGNLLVLGVKGVTFPYQVVKYDSYGQEMWEKVYPQIRWLSLKDFAVNSSGRFAILSWNSDPVSGKFEWVINAFDSLGNPDWTQTYGGDGADSDLGAVIQMDDTGSVYVTGYTYDLNYLKRATVVKFSPTGVVQWNYTHNTTSEGLALGLSGSGDVYMGGWETSGNVQKLLLTSVSPTGILNWNQTYFPPGNSNTRIYDLLVDDQAGVYYTGTTSNLGDEDLLVGRFSLSGNFLWADTLQGYVIRGNYGARIELDANGHMVVGGPTGYIYNTSTYFGAMAAGIDTSGTVLWRKFMLPQVLGRSLTFKDLEVDFATGNSYLTGWDQVADLVEDGFLIAMDTAGATRWFTNYRQSNALYNGFGDLALSANGQELYYVGHFRGTFTNFDRFLQARSQAGTVLWTENQDFIDSLYLPKINYWDEIKDMVIDGDKNLLAGVRHSDNINVRLNKWAPCGEMLWSAGWEADSLGGIDLWGIGTDSLNNAYLCLSGRTPSSIINNKTTPMVFKFDPNGQTSWINNQIPVANFKNLIDMKVDKGGNSVLLGNYKTTQNVFLEKLDPNGVQTWVIPYLFTSALAMKNVSLEVDGAGNAYLIGEVSIQSPNYDFFVTKFNASGAVVWEKRFNFPGNNSKENIHSSGISPTGLIVIAGWSQTNLFDYTGVVIAYDGAGNLVLSDSYYTSTTGCSLNDVGFDADGNIYVSGVANIGPPSFYTSFTAKYTPTGTRRWLISHGNPGKNHRVEPLSPNRIMVVNESGNVSNTFSVLELDSMGTTTATYPYLCPTDYEGWISYSVSDGENAYISFQSDPEQKPFLLKYGIKGALSICDTTICGGDTVQLRAAGGQSYQWTPTTSLSNPTAASPLAFPSATTTYTLVINQGSSTDTFQVTVSLDTSLSPAFSPAPNGLLVNFTDQTSGAITAWYWDFGDGFTSSQPNPQHTFATPGAYNVCLTVTGNCGPVTVCQQINVGCGGQTGSITYNGPGMPNACDFVSLIAPGGSNYLWSTGASTQTIFPNQSGDYAVSYMDSSSCARQDTYSLAISTVPVTWIGQLGTASGNDTLYRTVPGASSWGTSGASSQEVLLPNANGQLRHILHNTTFVYYLGFSETPSNGDQTQIDHAFYVNGNDIMVKEESGTSISVGTAGVGDTLELERNGNQLYWKINGSVVHTATVSPSLAWLVDVSMRKMNMYVTSVEIDFCNLPPLVLSATRTHDVCAGSPAGSLQVTVAGGTPPYSYSWSTGDTVPSLDSLSPGLYSLTVTDQNGGTKQGSWEILSRITWTNEVGATSHMDTLSRNPGSSGPWGSSGAHSSEVLPAGTNGSFWHVVASTSYNYYLGLTDSDPDASLASILYAFGNLKGLLTIRDIYGNQTIGPVSVGDTLEISRFGTMIYFRKNGLLLRSSPDLPLEPLFVDASLFTQNTVISNVFSDFCQPAIPLQIEVEFDHAGCFPPSGSITLNMLSGTGPYHFYWSSGDTTATISGKSPGLYKAYVSDAGGNLDSVEVQLWNKVVWEGFVGSAAIADTLFRTVPGGGSWGTSGARSDNKLLGNNDGLMLHYVSETNKYYYVGLSDQDTDASQTTLDYSFFNAKGSLRIREEAGNFTQIFGAVNIGDLLKIERVGSSVNYYQNGNLLRSRAVNPAETLRVDVSLFTPGTVLSGVYVDFCDTVAGQKNAGSMAENVGEFSGNAAFEVFPNPVNETLNFTTSQPGPWTVTVVDVLGNLLFTRTFSVKSGSLEVSEFPAGIYFLQLRQSGENLILRRKWVKL